MTADDLAQDTFLKAFQAWDTFQALASPKTWLLRIAYTTFCNHQRNLHPGEDITDYLFHETLSSPAEGDTQDTQRDIQAALQTLSAAERLCIQLSLMDDLSIREVARITGIKENTVKSHLSRGKEKLKTYLIHHGYDR